MDERTEQIWLIVFYFLGAIVGMTCGLVIGALYF